MQQGDHIDPLTGRRLIPLPAPWWFGASQRAQVSAYLTLVAATLDEPIASPSRWAWTDDGYVLIAC